MKNKKILLSSFACSPSQGSEASNGWNWAIGLAKRGFEVHCFTRFNDRIEIENTPKPKNLIFHYIALPYRGEALYKSSMIGMYVYYILWQWIVYLYAKRLHRVQKFDLVHHVTWGSTQMGSFLFKLKVPFIFGPAGGGQVAPSAFKCYFKSHWSTEKKREIISKWMLKYNPACRRMLREASTVLVSNSDTERMVRAVGAKNVDLTLDAALPISFFSKSLKPKVFVQGQLRLLWIGRLLPRKGILLLIDVMKELKDYPGINLTVVGDGQMKDSFLNLVERYQLQNTVIWKGMVPYQEVKSFYESHDIFVFTSLRDSCPAQLVEAMAYGLPIVTINLHGQATIVSEKTGFLADCSSPSIAISGLKEYILNFYNNNKLIDIKGKAAYEFAKEQTWDNKIDSIVKRHYPFFN